VIDTLTDRAKLAPEEQTGIPVATLSEILNHTRGIRSKVRAALVARFQVAPAPLDPGRPRPDW
jgi:hypothetical protein